jgi:hypothetical protein
LSAEIHRGDKVDVTLITKDSIAGKIESNVNIGDSNIFVTPSVLNYMKLGFQFILDSGNVSENLGETLLKNTSSNFCTTQFAASNIFSIPTYVKTQVKIIEDLFITEPRLYCIGSKKITASYLPANTIIRMTYSNSSPTITKDIVVSLDYMY